MEEKENKKSKVKIIIERTFGTDNLMEIYADYVAKNII